MKHNGKENRDYKNNYNKEDYVVGYGGRKYLKSISKRTDISSYQRPLSTEEMGFLLMIEAGM